MVIKTSQGLFLIMFNDSHNVTFDSYDHSMSLFCLLSTLARSSLHLFLWKLCYFCLIKGSKGSQDYAGMDFISGFPLLSLLLLWSPIWPYCLLYIAKLSSIENVIHIVYLPIWDQSAPFFLLCGIKTFRQLKKSKQIWIVCFWVLILKWVLCHTIIAEISQKRSH